MDPKAGMLPNTTAKKNQPAPLVDLSSAFEDQYDIAEERRRQELEITTRNQAIDKNALNEGLLIKADAEKAQTATTSRQLEILGGIDQNLEKANRAIQLSDSENPMDRLTLWMLQQSDPTYTRDGNLRRIEYYQQAAAAVGGINTVQQDGFTNKIKAVADKAELAKMDGADEYALLQLREAQGEERIKAASDFLATQAGMLQNTNTIQQAALLAAPDEAIQSAVLEAQKTGSANIGGVPIPSNVLQTEIEARTERKYNIDKHDMEMSESVLSTMTAEDVEQGIQEASGSENGFIVRNGAKVSLARLRERHFALKDMEYQGIVQAEALKTGNKNNRRESDDKILGTMSPYHLQTILNKGGVDESTGITFDRDQVETWLNTKKTSQSEMTQIDMLRQQGNLSETPAVDHMQYLNSLKVDSDSPVGRLITAQKTRTRIAASMLSDDTVDEYQKVDILTSLQASREQMDKTVDEQALALAGGDEDVAILQKARITNKPVPQDVMESIILDRATKKKSLAPFLDNEQVGIFNVSRDQALAAMDLDPLYQGMTPTDKMARAQAQALEMVKATAAGGVTERLMTQQTRVPGNPIMNAKIGTDKFMVLMNEAETEAAKQYRTDNNLTEEDMLAKIQRGDDPNLISLQFARTLMKLDELRPGLGKAYADWWTSDEAGMFVTNFVNVESQSQPNSKALAGWSLIAPDIQGQMQSYGQDVFDSYRNTVAAEINRDHQNFVEFGGDPIGKQVFLLEQTPDLSDSEKQIAMTILQPLIAEAKAQENLTVAQQTQFVESRVRNLQIPAGDAQRVWKKVLAGRDKAMKVVDDFITVNQQSWGNMPQGRAAGLQQLATQQNAAIAGFKWYQDMQK